MEKKEEGREQENIAGMFSLRHYETKNNHYS